MEISVLIPTRGRPDKLACCLAALARQDFDRDRFEVLVGVDGDDPSTPGANDVEAAHALAGAAAGAVRAVVYTFPHGGPGVTRNRLAAHARGRLLLLLNDDVRPEPTLLGAHAAAHAEAPSRAAMILGAAPWVRPAPQADTLFDRLVRETSLIFFYDQMHAALAAGRADAETDWGFRHAWTLNFSLPRALFEGAGGFDPRLTYPAFDDLEFAFRVQSGSAPAPVLYRPAAVAHHDHRVTPASYLARERMLGKAAWQLAAVNPACARATFGRDLTADDELAYAQAFLEHERPTAERLRAPFESLAALPPDVPAPLLPLLYQQHLLLKRLAFREGLLEAAEWSEGPGSA